jgi:hypothetical protein
LPIVQRGLRTGLSWYGWLWHGMNWHGGRNQPRMMRAGASPGRLAPSQETSAGTSDAMPSEGLRPVNTRSSQNPLDQSAIFEFTAPSQLDNSDRDHRPVPSGTSAYSHHSANFLQRHGHGLNVLWIEYAALQIRSNRHRFSPIAPIVTHVGRGAKHKKFAVVCEKWLLPRTETSAHAWSAARAFIILRL